MDCENLKLRTLPTGIHAFLLFFMVKSSLNFGHIERKRAVRAILWIKLESYETKFYRILECCVVYECVEEVILILYFQVPRD